MGCAFSLLPFCPSQPSPLTPPPSFFPFPSSCVLIIFLGQVGSLVCLLLAVLCACLLPASLLVCHLICFCLSVCLPVMCRHGERTRKCLQGENFVRCCYSTHSLLFRAFGGCQGESAAACDPNPLRPFVKTTLSTAGNLMASSERPFPEPLLKKEASQPRQFWKCSGGFSNALNYSVCGVPAILWRGIPRKNSETVSGKNSGSSSGKSQSQPYWGYGPICSA